VLDSGPQSYWRLDDAAGSTSVSSSVLVNEKTDYGTYSGVTLGQDAGPLAGSGAATAATFNGTSSVVTLPQNLVSGASYQSVSLWFKTTTDNGVLFSYQNSPLSAGTTTLNYTPSLYIGSDGKLNGQFWDDGVQLMSSAAAVTDGKWHLVTLTAAGNTQALYLDGAKIGSESGVVDVSAQANDYIGAGFIGGSWPDEADYEKNGTTAYATYFKGDISDVGFWSRPLTVTEAGAMYQAGHGQASLLTQVTRPSGKVYASVAYNAVDSTVSQVTDGNGSTWKLAAPTVTGSSQVYVGAVLGAQPVDYWRLGDTGTTDAVNQVNGGTAVFNDIGQGYGDGPFSDSTVDRFGGSPAYVALPGNLDPAGAQAVSMWFRTGTAGGVLLSSSADPVAPGATTPGNYTPILYIGSDGRVYGKFWDGSTSVVLRSSSAVDDSQWHNVVLTAGGGSQDMMVDGVFAASESSDPTGGESLGQGTMYLGAGFLGGAWPEEPDQSSTSGTGYASYFEGYIADVSFYGARLSQAQYTSQMQAAQSSGGLTPVQTSTVTDPGGKTLTYTYDPLNGDRELTQADGLGDTTKYGYDVDGFQDEVVDPDGDVISTGYDVRGNMVSRTTCQDQATQQCSTSYYTYYPDDTTAQLSPDPRNDLMLTSRDGRSASSTDSTYLTSYAYNSLGELTGETTPPVPGFASGRTTSYLYTNGTTSAGGYGSDVPPAGLGYQETMPGGAVTTTLYYTDGDVAQVTDPDGQRTMYSYDGIGRETSQTVYSDSYPGGLETTYGYDPEGQVTQETDPPVTDRVTGAIHTAQTTNTYDADGDVLSQTVADTTGGDASRTVSYAYNPANDLEKSSTDAKGQVTQYTYDAYGNLASETDPAGNVTDYAYDDDGRLLGTTLENYTGTPSGSQQAAPLTQESRAYDPAGRLASVTDSMGNTTCYAYTDDGLLSSVTRVSNVVTSKPCNNPPAADVYVQESDGYDAAGNMTSQVTNNGATTTDYTVDAADRTASQALDPSGLDRVTSYAYTPDDGVATEAVAEGTGGPLKSDSYTYDPMGNMTSQSLADPGAGGPAASFPLTQASGTSVPDAAPGGQPATAPGTTWTGGSGASFNSTVADDITTSGPVLDTTGSFTVSAWVNLAGDTTASQTAVSQDAGTDSGFYLKYYPSTGGWEFSRPQTDTTNPTDSNANSATTAATGTWTFLTGTYNVSTGAMTLYVNGAASGSATDTTPIAAHGALRIGGAKWDGSLVDAFDGQIADVQAYPTALTASQVSGLYQLGRNGTVAGAGAPAGWWNLTQPSGTTVPDASGSGNQATATGVTWAGNAASFAGTSGQQIATAGPVISTTSSFTVAAWANLAGNTTASQTVVSQDAGTDAGFYLKYYPGTGGWEFSRPQTDTTNPTDSNANAATTAAAGTWTFLTGTYNASTGAMTLYVNGAAAGTATDTTPIAAAGPLAIGRSKWDGSDTDWLHGSVADVQAYSTALTAAQVQALYQAGQDSGTAATGQLTTSWTLDERGLPTSETDPDGNVTSYAYDEAGRLAVTTGPPVPVQAGGGTPVIAHPVSEAGYDTFGDESEDKDPDGNITSYGYDADGRQVSQTSPSYTQPSTGDVITPQSTQQYNAAGEVASATDPDGNTTTSSYDQLGDLTSQQAPDGGVTSYAYDTDGDQLSVTGPTGTQTQATYDYLGRKVTSTQVETVPSAADYTTSYSYAPTTADPDGAWMSSQTTPDTVKTQYGYDAAGEETSVTDGALDVTSYGYDALGRQVTTTEPDGTRQTVAYDPAGDVTANTSLDQNGNVLATRTAAFDGDGDMLSSTDARGNSTTYSYDAAGDLSQEAQPVSASSAITTSFGYDAAGNRTRYTDGNGSNWTTSYNSLGLPESMTEPATSQWSSPANSTFTTSYDADGNPVTALAPGGVTVTDGYDDMGDLTSQSGAGATGATATRTIGYDDAGNVTSASTSNTATSGPSNATSENFSYDKRGLLTSASGTAGTTAVTWNGDDLPATVQDAAGTTSYTYDSDDRLATLADPLSGSTLTYTYNSMSQVSKVQYGTAGDMQNYGYNGLHELTSATLATASGSTVASTAYGYDPDGDVTSINTTGQAGASANSYSYDYAGRLTSWNNGTATTGYGYDADGNMTQDGTKSYTYDARDELTSDGTNSYSYAANGTLESELTPSGTVTSAFDAYGDQVQSGTQAYAYDALGRVASDTGTGQSWAFSYDGSTSALASDGVSDYTWDPSGSSLAGTGPSGGSPGSGTLVLTDQHGDVTGDFTASSSSLAGSQAYDPWGNVTGTTGTLQGQLGYQSGWTDPGTGKVAMGARWYSPSTGGFTSRDTVVNNPVPSPAPASPFAYVGDDPLGATDPTGHYLMDGEGYVPYTGPPAPAPRPAPSRPWWDTVVSGARDLWNDTAPVRRAITRAVGRAENAARSGLAYALAMAKRNAAVRSIAHVIDDGAAVGARAASTVRHWAGTASQDYHAAVSYGEKKARDLRPEVKAVVGEARKLQRTWAPLPPGGIKGLAAGLGKATVDQYCDPTAATGILCTIADAAGHDPDAVYTHWASSHGVDTGFDSMYTVGEYAPDVVGLLAGGAGGEEAAESAASEAASQAAEDAGQAAEDASQAADDVSQDAGDAGDAGDPGDDADPGSCPTEGGDSFTAATGVLLANGKTIPISSLKVGDKVKAVDTSTGKTQAKTVQAVLVHYDTNLYDLKVKTAHGVAVIDTTSNHLFWDPATHKWIQAASLKHGEHLLTADGTQAIADGGYVPPDQDGWMWDLTIQDDHDFYVIPAAITPAVSLHTYYAEVGNTPVLVHNDDGGDDFNQAMSKALAWLGQRGFSAEKPTLGRFGTIKGQPIGMQTADGKTGFRVEFDERSGAHINVWSGKEKGPHFTFDASESTVTKIQGHYGCH
jgi:RHS repeat-associated protein